MNHEHTQEEWLDIVDENDVVIGQKKRVDIYADNNSNFRAINAFIINSEGKLWIPRRQANKRNFPSALDMSVGGHVDLGETYDETFKREAEEELRIHTDELPVRTLGYLTPHKDGVFCFMKVYEIQMDIAPDYNTDDFSGYEWLTPKELLERIEQGEQSKPDLPKLIRIFYTNQ